MCRHKGVHESLEVGAPPLSEAVADLPIGLFLALAQAAHGREPLVQALLESFDLVVLGLEIISGELEEGVGYLEHEDVRVVVLVADQDAFAGAAHSMRRVMLLKSLQAGEHTGVLLGLGFLDTEGVVRERVQTNCLGLAGIEV